MKAISSLDNKKARQSLLGGAISFLWGFFEATWFFLVPDIALSLVALRGWRQALIATLASIIGSMMGAIVLYIYFRNLQHDNFENSSLFMFWKSLPGVYPKMFETAGQHIDKDGVKGLLLGPTSGIPFRIYIYEGILKNVSIIELLIWTPLARIQRVILAPLVVLVMKYLFQRLVKNGSLLRFMNLVIVSYWVGLYYWYWSIFLPQTYSP